MTFFRQPAATWFAALAGAGAVALFAGAQSQTSPPDPQLPAAATPSTASQTPPAVPPMNHSVVVLDPAHGGPDAGARLGDQLLEKDVTLALAARLRAALTAAGFTVISTREADSLIPLSTDQRAETANRAHALACLVIHATGTGTGVHLYASTLGPKEIVDDISDSEGVYRPAFTPTPWDTAQAGSVKQSLHLAGELSAAVTASGVPTIAGRATVKPLDNLMCPAVAVEVAPLGAGDNRTPVTDPGYQQRLAETLAKALQEWRSHADAEAGRAAASAAAWEQLAKPVASRASPAAGATRATPKSGNSGASSLSGDAAGGGAR